LQIAIDGATAARDADGLGENLNSRRRIGILGINISAGVLIKVGETRSGGIWSGHITVPCSGIRAPTGAAIICNKNSQIVALRVCSPRHGEIEDSRICGAVTALKTGSIRIRFYRGPHLVRGATVKLGASYV
jgi:hypothetical protein